MLRDNVIRLAAWQPCPHPIGLVPSRPSGLDLKFDEDLARRTIYRILEQDYGLPIVSGEYTIAASVADETQTSLLHVPSGSPLLVFDRTSFTASDKPVYHQKRFYRADRVQYRLTLRRTAPGENAIQSFTPVFAGGSDP